MDRIIAKSGIIDLGKTHGSRVTGIIGAMESEIAVIRDAMADVRLTTIAGMEFAEGTISGTRAVVVQCGMGKVNASICAQTLISGFGVDRVINTGVAGSLTGELSINDFVVSVDAVQHDYDVSAIGFRKGEIPYTGRYAFPADEAMRAAAIAAQKAVAPDIHAYEGRICSGDQFISEEAQKEKIIADFGGMCCEMEGAAIAQACYLNGTPFVVIRAISDKSDGSQSVEYETFKEAAAQNCAKIVRYMVENLR